MGWIHLAEGMNKWWALVSTVIKKDLCLLGYDAVSLGVFCDVGNHPPKDTVSYPRTLQYSEAVM